METIINSIAIKTILLLIIPIVLFLIMMSFDYSQLSKYSLAIGLILNPLFKVLAEPKVKEIQENIKEKRKAKKELANFKKKK